MKIAIPNIGLPYFENIGRCLEAITPILEGNIKVIVWNPHEKPIIDLFDEDGPDLIFMHEQMLRPEFNMLLQELDFSYVLAGGKPYKELHRPPSVMLTTEAALGSFEPSDKAMVTRPCADLLSMRHLTLVGDQWDCRGRNGSSSDALVFTHPNIKFEDNMLSMIDYLCSTHRTKIIGQSPINSPYYLGKVSLQERAVFIKGTKLVIDFGSYEFLDAAAIKTGSLLYNPNETAIKTFGTLKELQNHTSHLLEDDNALEEYGKKCHDDLIKERGTYHHACHDIFSLLGEASIAAALIDHLEETLL